MANIRNNDTMTGKNVSSIFTKWNIDVNYSRYGMLELEKRSVTCDTVSLNHETFPFIQQTIPFIFPVVYNTVYQRALGQITHFPGFERRSLAVYTKFSS